MSLYSYSNFLPIFHGNQENPRKITGRTMKNISKSYFGFPPQKELTGSRKNRWTGNASALGRMRISKKPARLLKSRWQTFSHVISYPPSFLSFPLPPRPLLEPRRLALRLLPEPHPQLPRPLLVSPLLPLLSEVSRSRPRLPGHPKL